MTSSRVSVSFNRALILGISRLKEDNVRMKPYANVLFYEFASADRRIKTMALGPEIRSPPYLCAIPT